MMATKDMIDRQEQLQEQLRSPRNTMTKDQMLEEIDYSLKAENNNLLVMVSNQQEEIETLRQECKDWAEEHNRIVLMLEQDRDEWKRRAGKMWEWMDRTLYGNPHVESFFLSKHPEAAKWFEEE